MRRLNLWVGVVAPILYAQKPLLQIVIGLYGVKLQRQGAFAELLGRKDLGLRKLAQGWICFRPAWKETCCSTHSAIDATASCERANRFHEPHVHPMDGDRVLVENISTLEGSGGHSIRFWKAAIATPFPKSSPLDRANAALRVPLLPSQPTCSPRRIPATALT